MDLGRVKLIKGRDFFCFRAPRDAFTGAIHLRGRDWTVPAVVLDLQRRDHGPHSQRVDGRQVPVVPFPAAHQALVLVLTTAAANLDSRDLVEILLPRRTFDVLADENGTSRIRRLDLKPGAAVDDPVMRHLGACLDHALSPPEPAIDSAIDKIAASVTVHIAQSFGGLEPTRPAQRGGLAPWQLRLAWATFNQHLDGSMSLDVLAAECGLSVSHFTRAFRRSTGFAPHRWLMQRRIEVAKDMMLAEPTPLAQVAVACGFADQSHFTRTFASLIGLTPGRWRSNQEREYALG